MFYPRSTLGSVHGWAIDERDTAEGSEFSSMEVELA